MTEEKENFTGDSLLVKYDSLKIIRRLQENWTDIGFAIFSRHKNMDGVLPPEHEYMEEMIKNISRLYKEYEIRINGENGKQTSKMRFLGIVKNLNSNYSVEYH